MREMLDLSKFPRLFQLGGGFGRFACDCLAFKFMSFTSALFKIQDSQISTVEPRRSCCEPFVISGETSMSLKKASISLGFSLRFTVPPRMPGGLDKCSIMVERSSWGCRFLAVGRVGECQAKQHSTPGLGRFDGEEGSSREAESFCTLRLWRRQGRIYQQVPLWLKRQGDS